MLSKISFKLKYCVCQKEDHLQQRVGNHLYVRACSWWYPVCVCNGFPCVHLVDLLTRETDNSYEKKNSRIRFRGPNTNLGNQTYPSPGTSLSVSPSVNNCDLITSDSTSLLSRDDFFNLLAIRLYFPSLSSFFLAISKSLQNSLFTPKNYHIRFRQMFFFLFISSVAIRALVKKKHTFIFFIEFP